MNIDLEALRVLEAVVSEGGFARAAAKLNKTQSAVSYQISKLEQRLGKPIFDRSGYRAELTPVGERLLLEGQRLLAQARYMNALVDSFAEGWEPRLELVVDGLLPIPRLLAVLKEIADMGIPTHIQLRVEFLGGVQYRFMRDDAEMMLALDYHPSTSLSASSMAPIEAVLVVSRTHQLASYEGVELIDLQQFVELTVFDSSYGNENMGPQFGGEKVFYLSDFRAKKDALLMGLGYGWMPIEQIREELEQGELVELDYPGGSRYTYTPVLVTRASQPLGRAGQILATKLRESFG